MTEEQKPEPRKTIHETIQEAFKTLDALIQKMMNGDKLSGGKPSPAKRALVYVRNIIFAHEMQLAAIGDALRNMSITNQLVLETLAGKGLITAEEVEATAKKMGLTKVENKPQEEQAEKVVEEGKPEEPTLGSESSEPVQTADSCPIQSESDSACS